MAKTRNRVWAEGKEFTIVAGSICPDTATDPSTITGTGFTVVHTSTGLFTFTFAESHLELVSAQATLQLATGSDKIVQFGAYSSTNKTMTLRVWDISDAAVADIAADANNIIHVLFVFRQTGVQT